MAQAENKVIFSEEGLDRIEQRLQETEKKASGLLARLPKDLQREWNRSVEAIATAAKYALPAIVNSAASAAAAPGKSTFAQVMQEAHKFRKETSLVAVATGKSYDDISGRILGVSKRVAEMPASVSDWGRAAKRAGGDFGVAIDALEVFKDRSVQLDKPLSEMQDSMLKLRKNFGIESKAQVADFFGTMDAQATKTGITADRVERQFMSFVDAFGRMSGKGSGIFTGISAAFAASSSNPEQAQRNQEYGMGTLNSGARIIEQRMRAAKLLGKGQHITDEKTGEVIPERYLKAMQFIQRDIIKAHGGSRSRAIEIEAGDDMGARRDVAGFFNTDLSKVKNLSELSPEQRRALDKYMGLAAGKRDQAEANKNAKDIGAGMSMMPAQDKAVEMGGGHAGLAMEAASGIFSTAVDKFGGLISGLGGFLAKKGGARLAATTAAKVAGKVVSKAVPVGLAYEVLDGGEAGGGSGVPRDAAGRAAMESDDREWARAHGLPVNDGPQQVTLSSADHKAIGDATASAMTGRVLTTQEAPGAPPGQPAPR